MTMFYAGGDLRALRECIQKQGLDLVPCDDGVFRSAAEKAAIDAQHAEQRDSHD